ncbi:Cna B-type domain-containing protein [Atopobium fossor]|uniref:Cna B-type domain-containing protein n=1 Tax=Atopobium fossor TaxID=39487 RepID=UPI0004069650|nr:Cna B-type domain-containing protein [Atopobium fossor]
MKLRKVLLTFLSSILCINLALPAAPVYADDSVIALPKSEKRIELEELISQAKQLGVTVTESSKNETVSYEEKDARNQTLDADYDAQITSLKTAIEKQKLSNEQYEQDQKSAIKSLAGSEWTEEQLRDFLSEGENKVSVLTTQDTSMKLMDFDVLKSATSFKKGQTLTYTHVFQDSLTGKWIDVALTFTNITNPITGAELNSVSYLNSGIYANQIALSYQVADITMDVAFYENGTDVPIKISPIVIFTDVDDRQAVKIDSPETKKMIFGSKLHLQDGFVDSRNGGSDGTDGSNRAYWAMFALSETDKFTYTFKSGSSTVLHGIGVKSTLYTRPQKAYESAAVSYTNLLLKQEKQTISGEKIWQDDNNRDGIRPNNITLALVRNGQDTGQTTQASSTSNWKYSFANLDTYDNQGNKINYSVKEILVQGYTSKTEGFKVTNTYQPKTTSVKVKKVWNDAGKESKRPASVTVRLMADGQEVAQHILNEQNNWAAEFEDVFVNQDGKAIVYTVQEVAVDGYTSTLTGDTANGFEIINTPKLDPAPNPAKDSAKPTVQLAIQTATKMLPATGDVTPLMQLTIGLTLGVTAFGIAIAIRRKKNNS